MILPIFVLLVDTQVYNYRILPNPTRDLGVLVNYPTRLKKTDSRLKLLGSCIFLQTVELIVSPLMA